MKFIPLDLGLQPASMLDLGKTRGLKDDPCHFGDVCGCLILLWKAHTLMWIIDVKTKTTSFVALGLHQKTVTLSSFFSHFAIVFSW